MQDAILQALRRNAADDAVALAREWATAAPDDVAAHRWLAVALQQQGQPGLALGSIDTALMLTPKMPTCICCVPVRCWRRAICLPPMRRCRALPRWIRISSMLT